MYGCIDCLLHELQFEKTLPQLFNVTRIVQCNMSRRLKEKGVKQNQICSLHVFCRLFEQQQLRLDDFKYISIKNFLFQIY